jgi:hypothetical protein
MRVLGVDKTPLVKKLRPAPAFIHIGNAVLFSPAILNKLRAGSLRQIGKVTSRGNPPLRGRRWSPRIQTHLRGKEANAGVSRAAPGAPGAGRLPHGEVRPFSYSVALHIRK